MSANKIAETSTSTGTGNITLAGAWSIANSFVSGNRTFNEFYGLNHRFPYMIQDQMGNWEKGSGYLSDSTTLVRETVLDNSLLTTALIDFPAGNKLVMVPTDAGSIWPSTLDSGGYMLSANQFGYSNIAIAASANQLILGVFTLLRPMAVKGVTFDVSTLAAGTSAKALIYKARNQNYNSMTIDLLGVGEPVSTATTGKKSSAVTKKLGQGVYLVGLVSDGAPTFRGNSTSAVLYNGFDNGLSGNVVTGISATITGSYANPPATRSGSFIVTASTVRVGLEGQFL